MFSSIIFFNVWPFKYLIYFYHLKILFYFILFAITLDSCAVINYFTEQTPVLVNKYKTVVS